jgi:hypothetical protein
MLIMHTSAKTARARCQAADGLQQAELAGAGEAAVEDEGERHRAGIVHRRVELRPPGVRGTASTPTAIAMYATMSG